MLIFSTCASAAYFAVGDYVQDTVLSEDPSDLFDSGKELYFDGYRTYRSWNFSSYTRSGAGYTKSPARILSQGNYSNIHSRMCVQNDTSLGNPSHPMTEELSVNSSKLSYYETGPESSCSHTLEMKITPYAVSYRVNTGYIPLKRIVRDLETGDCMGYGCFIDYEYRGKMLFFGEEYYVKDAWTYYLYLDKGAELNVSSSGFDSEYNGYRFRSAHVVNESPYLCNYLIIDVMKPDGTIVSVPVTNIERSIVDDIEISAMDWQSPRIMVYNLSTEVVLWDGEEVMASGEVMRGWNVFFATVNYCNDTEYASDGSVNDCQFPEYEEMDEHQHDSLLKYVSISYGVEAPQPDPWEDEIPPEPTTLGVNESIIFPNGLRIRFRGYMNANLQEVTCPAHESIYATYFLGSMEQGWTTTTTSTTTTTQPTCDTAGFHASGRYVKDTVLSEDPSDLLDPLNGMRFDGQLSLRKGDFTAYMWCGQETTMATADLLGEESYDNVENLMGYTWVSYTRNPYHDMEERIVVNSSRLKYYETSSPSNCSSTLRLALEPGAVSYKAYPDYIPLKRIEKDPEDTSCVESDCYMDQEYRGRMLFLGGGYYVKDIDGSTIYLANGTLLSVASDGYSTSYKGYSFKISDYVYASSGNASGIVLDVRSPTGSVSQATITGSATTVGSALEIAALDWGTGSGWKTASIIAYDPASEIIIADGQDLILGGIAQTGWKVSLATVDYCQSADQASDGSSNYCYLPEYDDMSEHAEAALLKSVSVTYDHGISGNDALHINDSLELPNGFYLKFKGYLSNGSRPVACPNAEPVYCTYFVGIDEGAIASTTTTSTTTSTSTSTAQATCDLSGDDPPCGDVSLAEVIGYINAWAGGQAALGDVVELINAWAAS